MLNGWRVFGGSVLVALATLSNGCASSGSSPTFCSSPSWSTIDDYEFSTTPGTAAQAQAIALDSSGKIVVTGYVVDASAVIRLVIRSSSDGKTWTTDLDQADGSGNALAFSPDSKVIVGGSSKLNSSDTNRQGYIHQDPASTTKYYLSGGTGNNVINGVVADASGNVYAAGATFSPGTWKFIRWPAGGSASVTDSFSSSDVSGSGGGGTIAAGVIISGSTVYVAGSNYGGSSDFWLVRKSTDGGVTWPSAGVFSDAQSSSGAGAQANGIFNATSGPHVVGYYNQSGSQHWKVRTTADGSTWTESDDYQLNSGSNALATSGSGNTTTLAVAGSAKDSGGVFHWIVRTKSTNMATFWTSSEATNWTTSDDFQLVSGKFAYSNAIAMGPNGSIYAAGVASDASDKWHWIVRKYACQ